MLKPGFADYVRSSFLNLVGRFVESFCPTVCNQVAIFDSQSPPRCIEHRNVNRNDHIFLQSGCTGPGEDLEAGATVPVPPQEGVSMR